MRYLAVVACLCMSVSAGAQLIQTTVGGHVRIPVAGVTAAYSMDADCADAVIEGDWVDVTGRSPCVTHIVTVTATVNETLVVVSTRQQQQDRLRVARLREQNIEEAGSMSTFYSSDPGELETAISLSRAEGDHTTSVAFSIANGYAFSPQARQTTLP